MPDKHRKSAIRHTTDHSGLVLSQPHLLNSKKEADELLVRPGPVLSSQKAESRDVAAHRVSPKPFREMPSVPEEYVAQMKNSKEANDEYEYIVNSLQLGILVLDAKLTIRKFNPAINQIMNLLPQDVGRPVEDVLNSFKDEERLLLFDELHQILADGRTIEGEVCARNGQHYLKRMLPFRGREGLIKGVILTFSDITEKKKLESLLSEASTLKAVSANIPGMLYQLLVDTSGNGRFVFASEQSKDIFGLAPEALVASPEKMKTMFSQADLTRLRDTAMTAGERLKPFELEFPIQSATGEPRWIVMRNSPHSLPDGSVLWNGLALDITDSKIAELKQSETAQFYRTALDEAPVLIWRCGLQGACDWHNQAWLEFRGRSLADEVVLGWEQGIHPEDLARYMAVKCEAFTNRRPFSARYRLMRHDGQYRWINEVAKPYDSFDDSMGGYLGFCQDVHELLEDVSEAEQARSTAEKANRAKNEFLADMSHEIRTPISAVIGMAQMTLSMQPREEVAKYIRIILDTAESLLWVINDILDFAKIEAGKMEIIEIDFNIREELEKALKPFMVASQQRGLGFDLRIGQDVPEYLRADPFRITQVVRNLVSNAVKFTEKGSVGVEVIYRGEKPNTQLEFSVRDSGSGIPVDKQGQLFTAFTQLGSVLANQPPGTGLGLAISKRLVEAMGGSIWLTSREGAGSHFSFTVDVKPGQPVKAQSLDAAVARSARTDLKGLRILLAEDNKVSQLFLSHFLRSEGCQVVGAENGHEALKALDEGRFDLVLMDIQMPGLDGVATTKRIRAGELGEAMRNIPIVALTAFAMKGDREKFLAAGLDDYVSKPVDFNELVVVLKRLLRTPATGNPESDSAGSQVLDVGYYEQQSRPALMGELYGTFVEKSPRWISDLDSAAQAGDWEQVTEIAHSILSMAISLRTGKLYEKARLLHQAVQDQDLAQRQQALSVMKQELLQVREVIQKFLATQSSARISSA